MLLYKAGLDCWSVSLSLNGLILGSQPEMMSCCVRLAASQPGFLHVDQEQNNVAAVLYWDSVDAIAVWRQLMEQVFARRWGHQAFYHYLSLKVERGVPVGHMAKRPLPA